MGPDEVTGNLGRRLAASDKNLCYRQAGSGYSAPVGRLFIPYKELQLGENSNLI